MSDLVWSIFILTLIMLCWACSGCAHYSPATDAIFLYH